METPYETQSWNSTLSPRGHWLSLTIDLMTCFSVLLFQCRDVGLRAQRHQSPRGFWEDPSMKKVRLSCPGTRFNRLITLITMSTIWRDISLYSYSGHGSHKIAAAVLNPALFVPKQGRGLERGRGRGLEREKGGAWRGVE